MRWSEDSLALWLSGALIVASCLFGGGSHAGFLGDIIVQLVAVPLIILELPKWCARIIADVRSRCPDLLLHAAILIFIGLIVLQLVPWALPHGVVGTASVSESTRGAIEVSHWSGSSTSPAATWAAAMSVLPVFAILLGVSAMHERSRLILASLVIAMGSVALIVGLAQVLQGPESGLRLFEFTNTSEAVGFFANRNHFAAQLYTTLVFAGIWFAFLTAGLLRTRTVNSYAILWLVASAILVVALLAGIMIARSRAGVVLAVAAMFSVAIIFAASRHSIRRRHEHDDTGVGKWVLGGLALGVLFAAQYGVHHILTRFETDPLDDYRLVLSPATFFIALGNLPFGTGLGSFSIVYGVGEQLQHLFSGYANRAHNDWAEFLLEGGVFSVIVGSLFLTWLAIGTRRAWQQDQERQRSSAYQMLQRGSSMIIVLLLGHSLVDYPLRTTSIAVLFGFSCATILRKQV